MADLTKIASAEEQRRAARALYQTDPVLGATIEDFARGFSPDWRMRAALELAVIGEVFLCFDAGKDEPTMLNPDQVTVVATPFLKLPPSYKMTLNEHVLEALRKQFPEWPILDTREHWLAADKIKHLFLKQYPYQVRGLPSFQRNASDGYELRPGTLARVREIMETLEAKS